MLNGHSPAFTQGGVTPACKPSLCHG